MITRLNGVAPDRHGGWVLAASRGTTRLPDLLSAKGIAVESRAKAMGHGIHPMLIVFPLGLLATAVIFDILY